MESKREFASQFMPASVFEAKIAQQQRAANVEISGAHQMTLGEHVLAGAFAGLCEVLLMYPLDVVKTRHQLQTATSATQYKGVFDTIRQIVKNEGAFTLYRGIISPILAEAPKRALKFASNETYKKWLEGSPYVSDKYRFVLAGTLAGVTEAFVNCPFEVVKVRMQSAEAKALYKSTWECTVATVRKEGALALYKGLEPQLWRNGVWNGAYFGIINEMKNALPKPQSKQGELARNFIAGFVAGSVATTFNTPLDVVKSRMQNVGNTKYTSALPALATIYREEGARALFKGYTARILRLGPGGGVMLLAFDLAGQWIKKMQQ